MCACVTTNPGPADRCARRPLLCRALPYPQHPTHRNHSTRRAFRLAALLLAVFTSTGLQLVLGSNEDSNGEAQQQQQQVVVVRRKVAAEASVTVKTAEESEKKPEAHLIQPILVPFKQLPGEWENKGISLTASGEPKSGTTWLARVIVELCLQLCGNPENTWCKMGGLSVLPNTPPAPRYDFEMLHADTGELFLHFKGKVKHVIPGQDVGEPCKATFRPHKNSFGGAYPCRGMDDDTITREDLTACLPDDKSPACIPFLPPLDPALRRMAVIFRDARNVVISEHRMRLGVFNQVVEDIGELEPFVRRRFKIIVAWLHQRWVWHTTALKAVSHVMFYEDLEADSHHLVDLAAFVGLDCTDDEADDVWQRHTYPNPPGDYTTYGLSTETLEWMNTTMSELLPEVMLVRYDLTPIYS